MSRIDQYPEVTSPPAGFELIGNDVTDTDGGAQPDGKTKRITAANLLAAASGPSGPVTTVWPNGTDDTLAINDVISSASGACQLVQSSTPYMISGPLTPGSGAILKGVQAGWASPQDAYGSGNANNTAGFPTGTVIQVLGSFVGEAAILIDNEDAGNDTLYVGPTLRDFYLDCRAMPDQTATWSVSGKAYNGNGIAVYGAFTAGQVEHVTVLRPQGSCFVFDNAVSSDGSGYPDNWIIRASKASGARGGAASVTNGYGGYGFCLIRCPDIVVDGNESSENGSDNWYCNDITNGMFSNNKGENSYAGNGWHFIGSYGPGYLQNFIGCTTNWNALNGFLWDETSGGSGPADYNMVGCKASNDGQAGPGYGGFVANGSPDRIMLTGCFTDGNTQNYGVSATNSFGVWVTGGNFIGTVASTFDGGGNTNGIVQAGGGGLAATGGTLSGPLEINSAVGASTAALVANNMVEGTYIAAFDAYAPNASDGDSVLFHVGGGDGGNTAEFAYIQGSPRVFTLGFQGGPQTLAYDDTGLVVTGAYGSPRNTLDDGSGNVTVAGVSHLKGGTDTSATAAASTPTFTTAVAKQLSTTRDLMFYIAVKTSIAVTLAIGASSATSTSIVPVTTMPVGAFVSVRIPAGWYVKLTCATMADLQLSAVTC